MTAARDLPVLAGAREIAVVLDRMHACEEPVTAAGVAGVVGDLDRIVRRVQGLKLRLLAQESASTAARESGFADTGSWLSRHTRATGRDAAREVRLAEDLRSRTATRAALDDGRLSPDHARVIADALATLPATLTADQHQEVEADLVTKAENCDPARLRREARRALAVVEADPEVVDAHEDKQVTDQEDTARATARLSMHDNGDGTVSGCFTVPHLAGDILRTILDAMTAPRRQGARAVPGHGATLPDWTHRRGLAFAELLEHLPTDHLHTRTAATVVVQLRYDVLLGALATAGLDTGHPISAATARRLACTAGVVPAVLGGASLPLDLGRGRRLFTEAQRVALATRHTHCAADGCSRPFAWCELHHATPWSRGGRTDLDQAVPLCGFHHRLIHDPGYTHHRGPDGIVFTRLGSGPRPARPAAPGRPTATGRPQAPARSQSGPRPPKTAATRPPAPRPRSAAPMRT